MWRRSRNKEFHKRSFTSSNGEALATGGAELGYGSCLVLLIGESRAWKLPLFKRTVAGFRKDSGRIGGTALLGCRPAARSDPVGTHDQAGQARQQQDE
jgi:hypothetical protein